jgi:hypothetical protein
MSKKDEPTTGGGHRREPLGSPTVRRNRHVGLTTDLPEEWVEAIRRAEVDPRHAHLDEIIKDWKRDEGAGGA